MDVERHDHIGESQYRPAVDCQDDIVQLQTRRLRCPSNSDVRNNSSPTSRQTQPRRERGTDVLCSQSQRNPLHMAGLAKVLIIEADDCGWNGKAQSFAAAAFA